MNTNHRLEKPAFWVLLGTLLVGFFWLLAPFYSSIIFALVLALTFDPLYQGCLKISGKSPRLSAALCLLAVFLFVAIPFGVIASLITNQLLKLAQTFQFSPTFLNDLLGNGLLSQTIDHWSQVLSVEINPEEWVKEILHNSAQYLYQFSPKMVSKTADFFLTSVITLILTYFLMVDGPKLYHAILEVSPLKEKHEKTLAGEIRVTLRACIYGYILTGLVQGILAGIGFALVGVEKLALLLGVATFILSFIPFLGAASVWIPVVIYLFAMGDYWRGSFLLVYGGGIVSTIDNFLKPLIIQGKTNIHPMLLFLAIFGGLKLWGPIGILAGPTLVAVFLATLKIYRQDFK